MDSLLEDEENFFIEYLQKHLVLDSWIHWLGEQVVLLVQPSKVS